MRPGLVRVMSGSVPGVAIRFFLRRRAPVAFLLQGPAPSCANVGRLRVVGRRGLNQIKVTGRIHGRRLRAGSYRVVPQWPAKGRPLGVIVSANGRVSALRGSSRGRWCDSRAAVASTGVSASTGVGPVAPTVGPVAPRVRRSDPPKLDAVRAGKLSAPRLTQGVAAATITGPVAGKSSNDLVQWLKVALGALLVLTIPVVLVAAIRHGLRPE